MSSTSTSIRNLLGSRRHGYQQVDADDAIPLTSIRETTSPARVDSRKTPKRVIISIGSKRLALLNISLLLVTAFLVFSQSKHHGADTSQLVYSPVSPAVEYEAVVFASGIGIEKSPFQGEPSNANNKLWEDLYDFGITRISAAEARSMVNKTLPIPDDEGGYVVQLSVFHQLHCLNLVRRGLYGEVDMSNISELFGIEHLDHCIDAIRQGIMCHADITPLTFARQARDQPMKAVAEIIHSCRKFTNIQQWALQRRVHHNFDKYKIVHDDPLGWGDYEFTP